MGEIIRLKGVSHYYVIDGRQVETLHDIDLSVEEGEFVCIVGPSGCGKSTLLNLLAGFIGPTDGKIDLVRSPKRREGRSWNEMKVVFQQASLLPWLTISGNVEFGLKMRGVPRAERKKTVDRLLRLVGLGGWEDKFPTQLSGGMQQRAAIARALAPDPQVLLMDEPFGALDAQMRKRMQTELVRIWSLTKKTILFVTHDIGESVILADRVVMLTARPGRIKSIVNQDLPRPREKNAHLYEKILELEEHLDEALT